MRTSAGRAFALACGWVGWGVAAVITDPWLIEGAVLAAPMAAWLLWRPKSRVALGISFVGAALATAFFGALFVAYLTDTESDWTWQAALLTAISATLTVGSAVGYRRPPN